MGDFKSSLIIICFLSYIFLISGLIVNFLQLLSCIFWPFNRPLFRKINTYLALGIWSQFTFLGQWWSKTDLVLYISPEDRNKIVKEHMIAIMNHKYDIDWLVAWMACQRLGILKGSKIVAKQSLKYVPILGWCWSCTETIFVRRVWESDRETLVNDLQRTLADYPENHFFNLMLSCEGTRFTEKKHLASMEIAREKGLPELKHHILPRTKGFTLMIQGAANQIHALYDITVGFKKTGSKPTLANIVKGKVCQAEMFVRRIPMSEIPQDSEACAAWVHQLYREKDDIFDHFAKNDTFEGKGLPRYEIPRNYSDLMVVLGWMVVIGVPSIIYFIKFILTSSIFSIIVLLVGLLAVTVLVQLMIRITETERGSHYGDIKSKES